MAGNLTEVLSNYIIYVDSSSLMHGNMEFFKISLFNVLKSTKRKIKLVDFVVKDLKKKQFSDSEKVAVKALNILEFYRRAGLIEDVVTSGIEQGKILDVIYNNRNVDRGDVCVITENKELANEIVSSLTARKGIDFRYNIEAVRLINGPALWDIQTSKPRVMPIRREPERKDSSVSFDSIKEVSFDSPKEEEYDNYQTQYDTHPINEVKIDPIPEIKTRNYDRPISTSRYGSETHEDNKKRNSQTPSYAAPAFVQKPAARIEAVTQAPAPKAKAEAAFKPITPTRVKRNKLVVSVIVDNSTSLDIQRSGMMKNALHEFSEKINASNFDSDLDLAVYGFDGFSPRIIKGYDGELDINRFDNGGIQVLGKTIELAMDELVERQKLYKAHNINTHKPWLIILSDGGAYGDLQEQVNKLKSVIRGKKITYFPFCLSSYELDPSLEPLAKLKMFLKIRDNKFTELFNFLYNTLDERINTPEDVHMTLNRKELAGFIAR